MATQAATMEFKKGDNLTHYFQLPVDSWSPGGLLWFTAKPVIDNDNSDAAAVINKSFNDSKIIISDDPEYTVGYVTYRLDFIPTDIVNVNFSNGATNNHYIGEFEMVDALGQRQTFPADDTYIDTIIYADVKRGGA